MDNVEAKFLMSKDPQLVYVPKVSDGNGLKYEKIIPQTDGRIYDIAYRPKDIHEGNIPVVHPIAIYPTSKNLKEWIVAFKNYTDQEVVMEVLTAEGGPINNL
ncbi:hypothetical protein MOF28_15450 [Bacillus haynesii]|uniref:hypothetical protein n=1 Tax=Bacillus haynesii TaxID=1925021 RepID=UPI00228223BD|nr:hypothetical protein [Bacillus haynesii]MCY9339750.1 hypothetical protein [Bacillus haynesii]